jgi:hypothetical protein
MSAGNAGELAHAASSYGGSPLGSLRPPLRGGRAAAHVEALLVAGAGKEAASSPARARASSHAITFGLLGTPYCGGSGGGGGGPASIAGGAFSPNVAAPLATSASASALLSAAPSARRAIDLSACVNGFNLAALRGGGGEGAPA